MTYRVLVPFDLPDASPVSRLLIDDLSGMEVLLLGHYMIPEQTPPDAARDQFEEEAQTELDALAAGFEEGGVEVATRLMFGGDRVKAIEQVATEEECHAVLDPAPAKGIDRILVPLIDRSNLDRLADFVRALRQDSTEEVLLFHVVRGDEGVSEAEAMLENARTSLVEQGFDPDVLDVEVVASETRDREIIQTAGDYDAVVMDEVDPDIAERILGTLPEKIARQTAVPVIRVRRPR